jgi:hypothetical protein
MKQLVGVDGLEVGLGAEGGVGDAQIGEHRELGVGEARLYEGEVLHRVEPFALVMSPMPRS